MVLDGGELVLDDAELLSEVLTIGFQLDPLLLELDSVFLVYLKCVSEWVSGVRELDVTGYERVGERSMRFVTRGVGREGGIPAL